MKHYLTTLIALTFTLNLYADKHDHQHELHQEHGAHVHGLAEMTLAQEGQLLEIELESPAANIVGFEHKASTDNQKQAIQEAEALLKNPKKLFSFNGTHCELAKVSVDVSDLFEHYDDEHDEHDEHRNHNDEHRHHNDEHESHNDEHNEHKETHSEIKAHYQFTCQQGSKLTSISVELLEHFSGIETLNTEWITDTKQGAISLSHDAKDVYLR